jgi:AraC-like DNA-binding protein
VLRPGRLLLIEPGDVHRELSTSRYSAVALTLRPELMLALTERADRARLTVAVLDRPSLTADTLALVEAVRSRHGQQRRQLEDLVESLAPLWTRDRARPEPALVVRARRALTEPAGGGISLAELGKRLGCAPSYLCRVFSAHTGVGPHAYQLQQRLLEAARLIESGRGVAAVAMLTGFGDESHLRRHFWRRFGVAPGHYQKSLAVASAHKQQPTYVVADGSIEVGEPVVTTS